MCTEEAIKRSLQLDYTEEFVFATNAIQNGVEEDYFRSFCAGRTIITFSVFPLRVLFHGFSFFFPINYFSNPYSICSQWVTEIYGVKRKDVGIWTSKNMDTVARNIAQLITSWYWYCNNSFLFKFRKRTKIFWTCLSGSIVIFLGQYKYGFSCTQCLA